MQTGCTLQLKIIFADISCILRVRSNKTSEVFPKSLSIYRFFSSCKFKIENFQQKILDIFLVFAQNID